MNSDTIAAIATAMSPSGIGIIRISGEDALPVIDRIYRSKYGHKKLSLCESHTIHYGKNKAHFAGETAAMFFVFGHKNKAIHV